MYPTTAFPPVDPSTRLALANLRAHLVAEGDFSPKAVDAIALHVATEGTVYDAPYVRLDEADILTEVFVRGFIAVDYDDPLGVPLPDDDHDDRTPDRAWPGRTAAVTALLPISGGALDDVPPLYGPSPEDWAEYHKVFDELDQVEPPSHTPDNVNRYSPDSLRTFRRTAWGA